MKDPMAFLASMALMVFIVLTPFVGCGVIELPPYDSGANPPAEHLEGFGMAAPDSPRPDSFDRRDVTEMRHSKFSDNGQGFTDMHGCHIAWRGDTSNGVDSLDVVNATIARMQWEQRNEAFASDQNAQALFHLMQARQTLEGKVTTTEDGLPIIE